MLTSGCRCLVSCWAQEGRLHRACACLLSSGHVLVGRCSISCHARHDPFSCLADAVRCALLPQLPWMQVGTPFIFSGEVSAAVADDISEFEQHNPGVVPVTQYIVGSPGGRFFQRWPLVAHAGMHVCVLCTALSC